MPFVKWFDSLDKQIRKRIQSCLERVQNGHYGDYKSVGTSIFELRFHFGSGYRIYFAEEDNRIVVLLCGGDKRKQSKDIERAKAY